ncbi:hypothetical protein CRM22_002438 [Opisthorchis felineus]|uniref:Protein FAM60A n=1 Tax=Opisthorchis felineus TaxID=147828 RepID=A0A4S2MAH2_OPIFE|nr:hypothetical protein CRM22_002438 [Opisthorchis felineus]TGZ71819.1 hypothetical protein CRM22_002438 [Opisthorchis felineus]
MSGGHSTGSGGGTSSSRSQFRSQTGCCICGTKSSSSRFTISTRYSEHFAGCFGQQAAARSGDLCNACVLCVKRWLQRDRQTGLFAQVLDSKKGPGPKHMKEITKRARRREARKANAMKAATLKADPNTNNSTNSTHVNRGATSTHSGPSFATRSTSNATASNGITSGGTAHRGPSSINDSNRFLSSRHGSGCNTNNSYVPSASGHHLNAGESARSTSRSGCQWSGRANAVQNTGHPTVPCCTQHQRMYFSSQPTGATFTRAAAAAIRKCEAIIQSTGTALSCSTPSRGGVCGACTGTKRTSNTSSTPSETSEYGSGLISLSCCSTSSGSHCPMVSEPSSSCCSNSSCGGASSGIGCGLSYSPPCCAFCCTGSDATPSKHGKYELDRSCLCRGCPCVGHQSLCHAASSMDCCTAPPEFRHPRPPPGNSSNGVGRNGAADALHAAADSNSNNSNSGSSSSVSTPPNSTPTRRYNRRVVLPPVRMSHNEEVNSLLREIMERNSQAITFDSREMHMAVQKELRLRSRTVQGNSTSDSVSGRASSISSADGSVDARTSSSTHALAICPNKVPVSGATDQHSSEHCTKRHRVHHCCARYHTHCCHLRHLPCVCSPNSHQHRKV